MTFKADGTEFVGLDADIFGDGDGDTQALDVFICQRVRGNQYFLNQEPRELVRSYYRSTDDEEDDGNYQGERPRASINPSDIVTIPIKLRRGLDGATIRGLFNVNDQGSDGSPVNYTLLVRDPFRQVLGAASGTLTNGADGYKIEELSVSFRAYANTEGVGEILFRIQSQDAGDQGSNFPVSQTQGLRWTAPSSGNVFNVSPGPASNSPELYYLLQDDSSQTVDIFAVDDTGSKTSNDIVFPDRTYGNSDALSTTFSFRRMTYLQIRSLSVELSYAEDRFGRVNLGSLQAKQAVRGRVSITQSEAINQFDRAPRMVSWGPNNYTDSRQQTSWPTDRKSVV